MEGMLNKQPYGNGFLITLIQRDLGDAIKAKFWSLASVSLLEVLPLLKMEGSDVLHNPASLGPRASPQCHSCSCETGKCRVNEQCKY